MKLIVTIAALCVLAAASASFADVTYADSSGSNIVLTGNYGSTLIGATQTDVNIGGAPDGVYVRFTGDGTMGGGSGSGTFTLAVNFPNSPQADIGLILFTGHVSSGVTVTVTQVDFFSSAATLNQATITVNNPLMFVSAASQLNAQNTLSTGNSGAYTTQANFLFSDIVRVQLTFSVTGYTAGKTFEFDAIANPEPGTIALFGLGAAGLGGIAWRRRRARQASRAATT